MIFKKELMKLYKPAFSIVVIIVQLILSLTDYFKLQQWKKLNPELDSIIHLIATYKTFFLFILIIGISEILTKPSLLKNVVRVLLVCLVLGYNLSFLLPIEDFKSGVYNTAWFFSIAAVLLITTQIVFAFKGGSSRA